MSQCRRQGVRGRHEIGPNCLEQSAKNLIALIKFIQLKEFKASKKLQIDREDI